MFGRDVAAGYGLDDGGPDIGAEEGGCDVGVVQVEDGSGEGGQTWCWRGREVNYLGSAGVREG